MDIDAAVKKIAELDAARTPDEWIEGLYTNNVAVASPADAPILKEWVEKYRAGAAHLPNIGDIRYRRLVSVGGDYGSTFSPEPYAGEGMTKADQAFIAAAPLMAAVVKQLWDERQQLEERKAGSAAIEEAVNYLRNKDGVMEADDYLQYDRMLKIVCNAALANTRNNGEKNE